MPCSGKQTEFLHVQLQNSHLPLAVLEAMWRHAYRLLHQQRAGAIAASCALGGVCSRNGDTATGMNCSPHATLIACCEGAEGDRPGRKVVTFRKRRLSVVPDTTAQDDANDDGKEQTAQSSDTGYKDTTTIASDEKSAMKVAYAIEIESTPSSPLSSLGSAKTMVLRQLGIKALGNKDEDNDENSLGKHHHTTFAQASSMEDQQLAFTDDKVGAFSAHGIEPHPYIVRDDTSLPFPNVEPQIVTLITQKINQDRGIVCNFSHIHQTALFGVFDGHGKRGERVAEYVMHEIPNRLQHRLSDLDCSFSETYLSVDAEIKRRPDMEPYHSGTTAVVAVLQGKKLSISNVGDSRAVIGRRREGGQGSSPYTLPGGPAVDLSRTRYESIPLTKDQNAKDPTERRRVLKSGGFVAEPLEPGLPARIYLDKECTLVGLAMSRSLGDHNMKNVGVIANPVITHHKVTDQDEFLVLASDGVWEFISSEEGVRIVGDCLERGLTASEASIQLIRHAIKLWKNIEGDYRDDITAIVVRLPRLFDT